MKDALDRCTSSLGEARREDGRREEAAFNICIPKEGLGEGARRGEGKRTLKGKAHEGQLGVRCASKAGGRAGLCGQSDNTANSDAIMPSQPELLSLL